MNQSRLKWCGVVIGVLSVFAVTTAIASEPVRSYGSGYLEVVNGLPVLHLKGTPTEMGVQYGYIMGDRIEKAVQLVRGLAIDRKPLSSLPSWMSGTVQRAIGWAFYTQFSKEDRAMLKAMVEGAKDRVPAVKLHRYDLAFLNSLIDIAGIIQYNDDEDHAEEGFASRKTVLKLLGLDWLKANCDSMAVWGPRTKDGKTFQTRNTDVETGLGLENFPLVVVQKQDGKVPFVSTGFVGQIGLFSGMNAYGLGLGQIWSFSNEKRLGTPWSVQMKTVFSSSKSVPEAVALFESLGKRTYGNNFVFADAQGNALAVETTPKDFEVFTSDDPREDLALFNGESYAIRLPYAVFRGDAALHPKIRSYQTASNGPDGDPRVDEAYILRYKGQADRIQAYEERGVLMGKPEAEAISRETAIRDGNIQAVVYANTDRELWVSYAEILPDGTVRQAYEGEYKHIPFAKYLPTIMIQRSKKGKAAGLAVQQWLPTENERDLEMHVMREHASGKGVVSVAKKSVRITAASEEISLAKISELDLKDDDILELRDARTGQIADRQLYKESL